MYYFYPNSSLSVALIAEREQDEQFSSSWHVSIWHAPNFSLKRALRGCTCALATVECLVLKKLLSVLQTPACLLAWCNFLSVDCTKHAACQSLFWCAAICSNLWLLYKLFRPSFCSVIYLSVFKRMTLLILLASARKGSAQLHRCRLRSFTGRDSSNCGVMFI